MSDGVLQSRSIRFGLAATKIQSAFRTFMVRKLFNQSFSKYRRIVETIDSCINLVFDMNGIECTYTSIGGIDKISYSSNSSSRSQPLVIKPFSIPYEHHDQSREKTLDSEIEEIEAALRERIQMLMQMRSAGSDGMR
jgi:hypothetical protein